MGLGKIVLITKCKTVSVPLYLRIFTKYFQTQTRALPLPQHFTGPSSHLSFLTLWNEVTDYSLPYPYTLFNRLERRLSLALPLNSETIVFVPKNPTNSGQFILGVFSHRDTWINFASKLR